MGPTAVELHVQRKPLPLVLSLLLGLASFGSGCAAQQLPESASAQLDIAPALADSAETEFDGDGDGDGDAESLAAAPQPSGPEVITFDELDGDAFDAVVAPPKREQIPSFQLFGEGDSESQPGPRLTLPPDME